MTSRLCTLSLVAFSFVAGCVTDSPPAEDSAPAELAKRRTLTLNDLAILFPLPEKDQIDLLLSPQSQAHDRAPLLPRPLFDQLPPLTAESAPPDDVYAAMRVVSIRFDPCSTGFDTAHGGECQPQIRLQLQRAGLIPNFVPGQSSVEQESAIHLIFSFDRTEFNKVIRGVLDARGGESIDRKAPLDIHPLMTTQGLAGAYSQSIKRLVLNHVGQQNLTRIAFTAVRKRPMPTGGLEAIGLDMGHFDVKNGKLTPRSIATTGGSEPQHETIAVFGPADQPRQVVTVVPQGTSTDAVSLSLVTDTAAVATASEARVMEAYDASQRVDNPQRNALETVDCVHCHSATTSRLLLKEMLGLDPSLPRPDRYSSPLNLTLQQTFTDSNIMFGYRARTSAGPLRAISQRVINETSESVRFLAEGW